MTSTWALRWMLVALTGVLAVVLITRGNILIGGLVGAIAVTRAILLIQQRHRRREIRERFRQRGYIQ
jgi:hypothetical protein